MIHLADSRQMKAVDGYSIQTLGIPSLVLMERAALQVALHVRHELEKSGGTRVIAICGSGNNGGDGLAAVRILNTMDVEASWFMAGDESKATEETARQLQILRAMGIEECTDINHIQDADILIDAIFGIGLARDVTGIYADIINRMNALHAIVCAVDIPSGISTDTGAVMGCAVQANFTVSFGVNKRGLVLYPGASYAGEVFVEDIGFPRKAIEEASIKAYAYEQTDIPRMMPHRRAWSNKGTYGRVLVIAGSDTMAGACYFAAKAAYSCGCGLVRIFTVAKNYDIILQKLPEAVMTLYDPAKPDLAVLGEALLWADSVVIGPGLSTQDYAKEIVTYTLQHVRVPFVVDADALNVIAADEGLKQMLQMQAVITPHIGEMSRLTKRSVQDILTDPVSACRNFAEEYGCLCVLKDARTVISDGHTVYVNLSGNHGMATGGSGDVLSGMIGGLLAQGLSPLQAASLGPYLHGCAGDEARREKGSCAMLASDILDALPKVLLER